MPPRARDAHKGDFGRVFILAGSTGFSGAAWFCGMAAVRSGAGLVTIGLPESIWNQVASRAPECMCHPLACDNAGRLDERSFDWILEQNRKADVCVCGPGLGRGGALEKLVSMLMSMETPLVLDADGINNKRGHILNCPLVLTPHEGEFRAMTRFMPGLGDGNNQAHYPLSQEERLLSGRAFVEANPCVLVLKGSKTLVFSPDGVSARQNTTGNPGLAKGGSGDVLAGVIGAMLGQGLDPYDAASAGVYIHGLAGDICAGEIGETGMTPSDVVAALPGAILTVKGC